MRRNLLILSSLFLLLLATADYLSAQGFTIADYKKALWMTTRFYGGQRSGENNWLLYNHLPSGVSETYRGRCFVDDKDSDGYDISGGWHDCGDHVKFGQTEFYSAYMLLKGYAEFPAGYDDYYSFDYKCYKDAGDWSWEGGKHGPNGIPDILDEVKYATDYFIKCTRNSTTFYYQVGQGNADHAQWVTAVKMQTLSSGEGGEPRTVYKNPADASMASFAGATLALMARVYNKFDPVYAATCLTHAQYAYDYAKAHPGVAGTGDGGFYGANDNWKDDYADMCAELYWATGNASYKTEALSFSISYAPGMGADIYGKNYGFDYTNNGDIAIYNLAKLGKANAKETLNQIVNTFYFGNVQSDGQYAGGNTGWGPLRYNANTALMVALWQKLYGTEKTPNKYIYDNIDYILGKNSSNLAFIVGFSSNSPKFPHHRNVYLRDDNPGDAAKRQMTIPTKNAEFGVLVGGSRTPGSFSDDVVNYTYTEGGIDYNACLVGSLAYLISALSPVDTNKFGHPTPDLGPNQSICGVSSILLDSKIATDGKKTFTWKKDGNIVQAASTTAKTYIVTQAGTYICVLDSAGKWSTQGSVTILGVLSDVALGDDQILCDPAYLTLDMGVTGSGVTYEWKKNGTTIPGATSKTLTIYDAATYRGTISASGCASKYDEIVITSKLPAVTYDTLCSSGTANLAVSGNGGPYEWYNVETGGTALSTGTSYSPSISSTTTYYVRDASSVSVTAGPSSLNNPLTGPQNGGSIGIRFTAAKAFTITQMKILPYVYSCNGDKVYVNFTLKQNGTTLATYNSDQTTCTGVQSGAPFNTFYTLNFSPAISIPAAGSYELTPASGNQVVWFNGGANFTTMDATGVIDITDDTRDDMANSFPGIFDIKVQAGSSCARVPVFAVIDPQNIACTPTQIDTHYSLSDQPIIYPNPSEHVFTLQLPSAAEIKVVDNTGRIVMQFYAEGTSFFGNNLPAGLYHVMIMYRNGNMVMQKVVKQ